MARSHCVKNKTPCFERLSMKEQILLTLWVIGLWFSSFCLLFKNEHIISKTETKNISIIRNSQEMSTYMCSRMIFVNRFLRFWWKFSGKRARIASAEDRSRNAASLVRRCRAWSSCRTDGDKGGEEKRAGDRGQRARLYPPACLPYTATVIQPSPMGPEASVTDTDAHVPELTSKFTCCFRGQMQLPDTGSWQLARHSAYR